MSAKGERAARRETKRTLGQQLSEFALNQHARLAEAEQRIEATIRHLKTEHLARTYQEADFSARIATLESLTRREHLTWLVMGRLPAVPTREANPELDADPDAFWKDLGRPPDGPV